jgi:hypothetical protein
MSSGQFSSPTNNGASRRLLMGSPFGREAGTGGTGVYSIRGDLT